MKNYFKLTTIVAIAALTIASCSKDDDSSTNTGGGGNTAAIVGTYDVNNLKSGYYINNQFIQGDTTTFDANELVVQFTADGKLYSATQDSSAVGGYERDTSDYSISGTKITTIDRGTNPPDTTVFDFTLTGNALRLSLTQIDTTVNGVIKITAEYNATKR